MTSHDLLWKSLLQAFLHEFLEFVAPDLLETHQTRSPSFLEQEAAADLPKGRVSRLDVLARLSPRDGANDSARLLLIHVEIERDFRSEMDARMWRYYRHLRLKYEEPVLPVVLYLRGGGIPGLTKRSAQESLLGVEISSFTYWAFGLSEAEAADYLGRNALAPALASCMDSEVLGPAELKLRCLEAILDLQVDDGRKFLLVNAVETYIELKGDENMNYSELVSKSQRTQEIEDMELTWAGRLQKEAEEKGLEKGQASGRAEGFRSLLELQIDERFGPLDEVSRSRLQAIDDLEKLRALGRKLLSARSLADLGLTS